MIEKNWQYMEGTYAGNRMVGMIHATEYKTVENAIAVKQALIDNFESQFGFSRDDEKPDSNYAYNLGILDALKLHTDGV
jgi:hypothetical protein